MRATELIERKRDRKTYGADELRALVDMVVSGEMRDEQVGAWLMAVYLNGLDDDETCALTKAMAAAGERIDLSDLDRPMVDKHSTGGVGDKTTLIVAPILAALGVGMLKMSGRGLGFTGGTLDKLEAIPGFRTDLGIERARQQVRRIGLAIVGQSPNLAPADKRLYAIRDVTATVGCVSLITASILSKKLAGGARNLVLDVKFGSGAFMKTRGQARRLADGLVNLGEALGIRTVALTSDMNAPLGRCVGNALEVREAIEVLRGDPDSDPRLLDLCKAISAAALTLVGYSPEEGGRAIAQALADGAALRKLAELIEAQGGDPTVVERPERLPAAPVRRTALARDSGFVVGIDAEGIGRIAMEMGAGRRAKEDPIDPSVGVVLRKRVGDHVQKGEPLAELHLRGEEGAQKVGERVCSSFRIADRPAPRRGIVSDRVGPGA